MGKHYIQDITEARVEKLFTAEFGNNIANRIEKLKEEIKEMEHAYKEFQQNPTAETREHFYDEVSDCNAVLSHLTKCCGMVHQQALEMAMDKVITRKTNPDYKRYPVQQPIRPIRCEVVKTIAGILYSFHVGDTVWVDFAKKIVYENVDNAPGEQSLIISDLTKIKMIENG